MKIICFVAKKTINMFNFNLLFLSFFNKKLNCNTTFNTISLELMRLDFARILFENSMIKVLFCEINHLIIGLGTCCGHNLISKFEQNTLKWTLIIGLCFL